MSDFGDRTMNFDFPAFAAGLRTAGALLIGNSFLVFTGVLGQTTPDGNITALKVLTMGTGVLLFASLTRSTK
jgi:hypothetical protein